MSEYEEKLLLDRCHELEADNARLRLQLAEDAADHNRCMEVMGRKVERLRAFIQGCSACKEEWEREEARRALEEKCE